jgi:hypothetical protein
VDGVDVVLGRLLAPPASNAEPLCVSGRFPRGASAPAEEEAPEAGGAGESAAGLGLKKPASDI